MALILTLLLAACGAPATPLAPTAAPLLPIAPTATGQPAAPAPTVAAEGEPLPGRLLFVKSDDIWIWEGRQGRQLTHGGGAAQPAWAPDGQQIIFVRRGQSYSDLAAIPAAGGEPELLTDNGSELPPNSLERVYDVVWAFYPAVAPAGDQIAFVSQFGPPFGSPASDHPLALFAQPRAPGGVRELLFASEIGHVGRLCFTPDGAAIIFALAPTGAAPPLIMRYDRASSTAEPLAGAPEQSYDPAVSPDGRWVAFATRDGERTDIFAIPAGGDGLVRLTSIGAARAPAFSPDGTQLAFLAIAPDSDSFDMWVADLQVDTGGALYAGEPRRLTRGLRIDAGSGLAWGS
jgi:TolB protein